MPNWLPIVSAGVLTALGWFATYYFGKLKEDRTRRLELRIKHLQRQIEEFYGPLYNLIIEVTVSKQVLDAIVVTEGLSPLTSDQSSKLKVFVRETQMKPLHEQIIAILRTKLYLVDGTTAPASFHEYLRHSIQERLQREIGPLSRSVQLTSRAGRSLTIFERMLKPAYSLSCGSMKTPSPN